MTAPNERDDESLRSLLKSGAHGMADQEFGEAFAAYQKVEALFDLLRRPATAFEPDPVDDLAPGKVLGEFAILRPLASGGMGQVYLARQESLGRSVALKVCKPEIARDLRMKNRFIAEALSLAQLAHPNVVPVLSTGEDQGYLYLAMEYVAGPTLAQVLETIQNARPDSPASTVVARVLASPDTDEQSQSWGEGHARLDRAYQTWAVQTLQQVAQGLAAAHAAGILHRDIKPANIVFAANGVPKIVDFGLARTARAPSTTVIGEFYGTPSYTSPEQARGDVEAVSPASDVFSLGVMLFECLSLVRPFAGRSLRALDRRQDAIKWYRRAVQLSGVDPGLLSEFLRLVVEEQGAIGLLRELPAYEQARLRLDVRLNATLSCFSSWAALATGDDKAAFENLVQAHPYILLASQQPVFGGDEGLVCGVILAIISEKLADSKRSAEATEFLKRFPAERIKVMKQVFSLPRRK